jgi:protein-tyrosine phosphatase
LGSPRSSDASWGENRPRAIESKRRGIRNPGESTSTRIGISQVNLGSFNESGSDLGLAVNRVNHTSSSVLADVDVSLDPQPLGDWTIAPAVALGYELAIGNPQVVSIGSLYGFTVSQISAYDSRYLLKAGLGVTAQHAAFTVKAGIYAVHGDGSNGVNGQLSLAYRF